MGEACRGERCDRDGETKTLFGYRRREERSVKLRAMASALWFATEFFFFVTWIVLGLKEYYRNPHIDALIYRYFYGYWNLEVWYAYRRIVITWVVDQSY